MQCPKCRGELVELTDAEAMYTTMQCGECRSVYSRDYAAGYNAALQAMGGAMEIRCGIGVMLTDCDYAVQGNGFIGCKLVDSVCQHQRPLRIASV